MWEPWCPCLRLWCTSHGLILGANQLTLRLWHFSIVLTLSRSLAMLWSLEQPHTESDWFSAKLPICADRCFRIVVLFHTYIKNDFTLSHVTHPPRVSELSHPSPFGSALNGTHPAGLSKVSLSWISIQMNSMSVCHLCWRCLAPLNGSGYRGEGTRAFRISSNNQWMLSLCLCYTFNGLLWYFPAECRLSLNGVLFGLWVWDWVILVYSLWSCSKWRSIINCPFKSTETNDIYSGKPCKCLSLILRLYLFCHQELVADVFWILITQRN